jgi:opacity protein-like surface antigen
MRTIAAAIAGVLATTVMGSAADLMMPVKSFAPPVFTWDGFYLGVHAGYGWGSDPWTFKGWDHALFYAKGGVAAGDTKDNFAVFTTTGTPAFIDFGTKTNLMVGWTAGAGIEYAFAPHWTAKIEYNYVDLGGDEQLLCVSIKTTRSLRKSSTAQLFPISAPCTTVTASRLIIMLS